MSILNRGAAAACFLCALTSAAALVPGTLHAQAAEEPRNVLSTNPIGAVFGVFHLEYERAVSSQASVALAGTVWNMSEDYDGGDEGEVTYLSSDLKLRYYPVSVLRGFSIGALGGVSRVSGEYRDCEFETEPCTQDSEALVVPSAGVELDYAWRMGSRDRFYLALGVGAKRLFVDEDEIDSTVAYPFLRFNIGWAF